MLEKQNGRILKSIGGFYQVETSDDSYMCKARGLFRLQGITPCTGDFVELSFSENSEPLITEILPRKNVLVRPPLANLDAVAIIVSVIDPSPSALVMDKLIAILEMKKIEPLIIFTKIDRKLREDFFDVYRNAGFRVFLIDNISGTGIGEIKAFLEGRVTAFIGNSGVGKSSLVNVLLPELELATAATSKKLGRGKHTTRHVELYHYGESGFIADTPGFSTVEASKYGTCASDEVDECFREFSEYKKDCAFADCRHTKEADCGVRKAVENGYIAKSRYQSYLAVYEDIRKAENTY